MIYRLIVLNGPAKGQRITVDLEPMTIGRDEGCDITLPDEEMAKSHARLEHRGNELFIHDLGSSNKVIVNKLEVKSTRIKHGDTVELGRTRLLVEANVVADVETLEGAPTMPPRKARNRKLVVGAAALLVVAIAFAIFRPGGSRDDDASLVDGADEMMPEIVREDEQAAAGAETDIEDAEPIDSELRRIREDLMSIQQNIENLNRSTGALADTPAPETEAPALGSVDEIETVMTAVGTALDAGDFQEADQLLQHIQLEHPDYLPAYRKRAELYEAWGMPDKAREQWSAILQRTTESELYRKAVVERIRLGRMESKRLITAHDAVRIDSIEQVRFRENTEYDEMRLVKVHLVYDRDLGPIDPNGVRLLVYFFEKDLDTQRIELSKILPFKESRLGEMENTRIDQFTQSISYTVPKGYYERDHHTSRQRYYGFIVRLHYFDRLVDEQARPPKLLEPAILESAGLAMHTADTTEPLNPVDTPAN